MAPTIALNNGTVIPQIGFGTLNIPADRVPSPENTAITAEIVNLALQVGYRLVDTAQSYGNERGVGEAIAASHIPRDEFYVTSKLANWNHRPVDVLRSFEETLDKLGLQRLDLFLIHWPLPTLYDGDYVSTWKAMTELIAGGRLASIGVSNFQPAHLDRIIVETGVVPAVNQIEVHPGFNNDAARAASRHLGIAVEAWKPLGQGRVFGDETIGQIASRHGRSNAQIILRWHLQHGHVVVVKTTHRERMETNLDVFSFELTDDEMAAINGLDKGEPGRTGPHPDSFDGKPRAASSLR